MPPREWRLRIEDILDAAARIARYVEGKDLAMFVNDDLTLDAVSRCFGIMAAFTARAARQVLVRHNGERQSGGTVTMLGCST